MFTHLLSPWREPFFHPLNDLSLPAFLDKFMEKKPKSSTWHGDSQIEPAKKGQIQSLRRAIEDLFRLKGQSLPLCLDGSSLRILVMCERLSGSVTMFGWKVYGILIWGGLKELNNFSKKFQGAEEELSSAMRRFQFPSEISRTQRGVMIINGFLNIRML